VLGERGADQPGLPRSAAPAREFPVWRLARPRAIVRTRHAGSRLKPRTIRRGAASKASLPAELGNPPYGMIGDRGDASIIRSPLRVPISGPQGHCTWPGSADMNGQAERRCERPLLPFLATFHMAYPQTRTGRFKVNK